MATVDLAAAVGAQFVRGVFFRRLCRRGRHPLQKRGGLCAPENGAWPQGLDDVLHDQRRIGRGSQRPRHRSDRPGDRVQVPSRGVVHVRHPCGAGRGFHLPQTHSGGGPRNTCVQQYGHQRRQRRGKAAVLRRCFRWHGVQKRRQVSRTSSTKRAFGNLWRSFALAGATTESKRGRAWESISWAST